MICCRLGGLEGGGIRLAANWLGDDGCIGLRVDITLPGIEPCISWGFIPALCVVARWPTWGLPKVEAPAGIGRALEAALITGFRGALC